MSAIKFKYDGQEHRLVFRRGIEEERQEFLGRDYTEAILELIMPVNENPAHDLIATVKGRSWRSPVDQVHYAEGRKHALERLTKKLPDRNHRRAVWQEYFCAINRPDLVFK